MAKGGREKIKLESTAGTGHFYTTTKNKRTTPEKIKSTQNISNEKIKGNVTFKNVAFHYPSRPEVQVLKEVNFIANHGQKIAIVGPSGAGKSTISSLLLRFYDIGYFFLKSFQDSYQCVQGYQFS